ncbi:hypothetical protein Q5752_004481 [Cryptotrichosporon argae]
MDALRQPAATPEVEPIPTLLSHALLQDPVFLATAGGLLLILVLFSAFRASPKKAGRKGTPTVVLVGPSDSGKTSLFAALAHQTHAATHTSLTSSRTTFSLSVPSSPRARQVTLVDVPGHARLRDALAPHLSTADGTVFVVDASAVVRAAAGVAERLAPVLSALAVRSRSSGSGGGTQRLLILAHKADALAPSQAQGRLDAVARAKAVERVRTALTRELERLKAARAGGAGGRIEGMARVAGGGGLWARLFGASAAEADAGAGASADDDDALVWGAKGAWRWDDVEGVEIEWAASALGAPGQSGEQGGGEGEADGLDAVREFMYDL